METEDTEPHNIETVHDKEDLPCHDMFHEEDSWASAPAQ